MVRTMNRKIALAATTFLCVTAKIVVCTEESHIGYIAMSAQQDVQTTIQKKIQALPALCSEQNNAFITSLKNHPYKITASLAAIGIAGASYFVYSKYQERLLINTLRQKLKELKENKIQLKERQEKIKGILLPYSKKVQRKALLAQDEKGDTIIHRALEVHKIKEEGNSNGEKNSANNKFIFFLIKQCKDTDTKITLLNTKNNEGTSAYHAMHNNFTDMEKSYIRGWTDPGYLNAEAELPDDATVEWGEDRKPLVIPRS